MSPSQLMKHYKNNKSEASRDIGCSRATLGNWVKAKKIPLPWQALIEKKTANKLRADAQ